MSSLPVPAEIAQDAAWCAQALDPAAGLARLVRMDAGAYRAASFLDDRLLHEGREARLVRWDELAAALAADARRDARWIFHIGHVGSTLVSRLLGELPRVLAVREPRLLRDLALAPPAQRQPYLAAVPALMSRTFAPDEIACVKATSFASEIATGLVPAGQRALFLFAHPRHYVASILAGENSVRELRLLEPTRAQRLAPRADLPAPRHDADRAAAAWACEMMALEAAAEAMADRRVMWADFDAMLGDMEAALGEVAGHFGFTADDLGAIARGPWMTRYSKAPEHDYSPGLRAELIAEAAAFHARDIADALGRLHQAAGRAPLLARALERA